MKASLRIFGGEVSKISTDAKGRLGIRPGNPKEVCNFLTRIGPTHVISVCVSGPQIIVWYWEDSKGEEDTEENQGLSGL